MPGFAKSFKCPLCQKTIWYRANSDAVLEAQNKHRALNRHLEREHSG